MHKKLARFTFFPLSCLITTIESLFLWFVHFTTKSAHKCRFFSLFILLQIKNSRQARIGGKRVKPKKTLFTVFFLWFLFYSCCSFLYVCLLCFGFPFFHLFGEVYAGWCRRVIYQKWHVVFYPRPDPTCRADAVGEKDVFPIDALFFLLDSAVIARGSTAYGCRTCFVFVVVVQKKQH